ncbi:MAG: xanthine dehydrogenase family protein molybdopterin-binding subunit [Pseudomonadota bacterium]|nr:xanthine dehydrogenase family protein molybdopterin-binding subunit [Pseudomonadota bacterium]
MATILEESGFNPDADLKVVGTNPVKHDGLDKVLGRAKFGADAYLPGMLYGKILRSPHAHAIIKSIDTSKAEALPGVKAVITSADFPEIPQGTGWGDMSRNTIAREKALFDGHPVAAVAATSEQVAKRACKLVEVEYEVLPHVIDVEDAMAEGAPILHDYMRTKGDENAPDVPTNVCEKMVSKLGDVAVGFEAADCVVEHEFDSKPMHQGYIEPQGCIADYSEDGLVEVWTCTQAPFVYRDRLSAVLKIDAAKINVQQSELGGGFGGKTGFYAEPLAIILSKKASAPVKMTLTRAEVFRGTGPVSGTKSRIKMGCTKDGKITAAEADLYFQTGPYTGSMYFNAPNAMFTRYELENVYIEAYEVVSNRPKVNSFRAPCVPQIVFGVEGIIDEMAKKVGMDPIDFRLKNAAKEGHTTIYGDTWGPVGFIETLEAAKETDHYKTPVKDGEGRGISCGFWFNRGGETSSTMTLAPDGTVTIATGTADVAGSRISIAMMAAEELGISVDKVRVRMADTNSLGFNRVTAGSRTTFSVGMVVVDNARKCITELCRRAANIWGVAEEEVVYEDGQVKPASSNVGDFEPMSVGEITSKTTMTNGAIVSSSSMNVTGAGPGFGVNIVDLKVDEGTGRVDVLRWTVVQDAGKAIHPVQVEGQLQGAAIQGMGWALNEEYIYTDEGKLDNPGFLDYRMPVASDAPMVDCKIVEIPNPKHPFGLRGVGEVPVVPTMAAVGNAITDAIGIRPTSLPMSPPKLLKLIEERDAG